MKSLSARPSLTSLPQLRAAEGRMSRRRPKTCTGKKKERSPARFLLRMLVALGVTHVIIGHSERRQYFGETDDTVNSKLKVALEAGLTPIVCVGEVFEEREAGLDRRRSASAVPSRFPRHLGQERLRNLVVAYEPVWAIGTGKTATPQMAADAHAMIRGRGGQGLWRGLRGRACGSYMAAR